MEVEATNEITILVGEEMFSFDSCQHWVNKAKGWYARFGATSRNSVAVDSMGRICTSGKEFERAESEGTFPVRVYNIL